MITKSGGEQKKQVRRRRLHTSRPYQERLLNMAEARRQILTALKYHRASMKQQQLQASPIFKTEANKIIKSRRRNPTIYNYPAYFVFPTFSDHPPPPPAAVATFCCSPPVMADPLDFPLPNQTLGLNLNFHDFETLSPTVCVNACEEVPSISTSGTSELYGGDDHDVMMMAEIRSIGDRHEIEWNDKMNLVTSGWWFKFLKNVELKPEVEEESNCYDHPFDEVMDFPSGLNSDEQCFDEYCTRDFFQDPALPWLDIGEIEEMEDGEWLS